MGQVLEAKESFTTEVGGQKQHIVAGATRVDESHELVKRFPQHFKPIEASFGVEAATDTPGEVRSRVAAASETGGASVTASDDESGRTQSEPQPSSEGTQSSEPSSDPAGDPGTRPAGASKRSPSKAK